MTDIRTLLRTELANRGQSTTKTPSKPSSKKRKAAEYNSSPSHDHQAGHAAQQQKNKKRNISSSTPSLAAIKARQARDKAGVDDRVVEAVPEEEQGVFEQRKADADADAARGGREAIEAGKEAHLSMDTSSVAAQIAGSERDAQASVNEIEGKADTGRREENIEVDEAEWAAFESDIARAELDTGPPRSSVPTDSTMHSRPTALNPGAGAVIEAKPMSAEELAKQAREEQSVQRGRREVEAEEEREEASRRMEEEFEEMEGLEERVRRLRERREGLRGGSGGGGRRAGSSGLAEGTGDEAGGGAMRGIEGTGEREGMEESSDEDDEDEDGDDVFELWRRR